MTTTSRDDIGLIERRLSVKDICLVSRGQLISLAAALDRENRTIGLELFIQCPAHPYFSGLDADQRDILMQIRNERIGRAKMARKPRTKKAAVKDAEATS